MNIQRYDSYKDSGVEWHGLIPSHWDTKKVKDAFKRQKEEAQQDNPVVLSLTNNGVKIRNIDSNEGQIAKSYYGYHKVKKGDLLLNPMDLISNAFSSVSEYSGVISPAYFNLKSRDGFLNYYFAYYFKLQYWNLAFYAYGKGVSSENRWTLNNQTLKNYSIFVPPFEEQQRIADFLDRKNAQIDEAIAQKEKMIELFKEYKQITINNAVTKGLYSKILMKDSGIEWLGQIPEHWEVKKLKFILIEKLKYGANESGVEYNKKLPRYIRITDFGYNGKLSNEHKLSLPTHIGINYLLNDGDILFARSGATVGKSYQFKNNMSSEVNYCFAGYLIKGSVNEKIILSNFLYLYTKSPLFYHWKNFIFNKATIENIGADKYAQLFVIIPPIKEQAHILEVFKKNNDKIESVIICKQLEIKKLKEYKATLIDSAVTGKIKV